MMVEQKVEELGKEENACQDASSKREDKLPVYLFPRREIETLNGCQKIAVDAGDIGDGPSRNAGNKITNPHHHADKK